MPFFLLKQLMEPFRVQKREIYIKTLLNDQRRPMKGWCIMRGSNWGENLSKGQNLSPIIILQIIQDLHEEVLKTWKLTEFVLELGCTMDKHGAQLYLFILVMNYVIECKFKTSINICFEYQQSYNGGRSLYIFIDNEMPCHQAINEFSVKQEV